jgi:uncharacterized membrane protein YhaH (DUF805 family)
MEWYLKVVRDNYANFNGRATRQEYWMFTLFNGVFSMMVTIVGINLGIGYLSILYSLAVLIPGFAVAVRRLHDVNKSGWWLLIMLIPLFGIIWLLVLMCTASKPDENRDDSEMETPVIEDDLVGV